ncbi:N-acetylneuraminate synthase family protein [uncultured Thomasclavelia sp.]|uniref:N-acetylneuraminate synthase family protein n=1 Tax=uncultured Thomasclavelia sp. TaxID=3025759 RepID=UPI002607DAE0|nr:N-acetylneuraminate synthase family protein [uncultured Thomasclavelia sp.]
MKKPFIIAEVGVNFYDTAKVENIKLLDAAKKYILEAKNAGADAVKFQSYKADTIVSKNSPAYWDLAKEPTKTQHELFSKHDSFNEEDYVELYNYSKEVGIKFMSTPFDYNSADYLENIVDIYKISSSDLSNLPFIEYISKKKKPIYLSVGASYLSEVDEAVRVMKDAGCPEICLLHCVLSYPCKNEDANLNMIKGLKRVYPNLKIGYSDHTLPDDNMTILTTAYLYGAEVIEKHFTLDKTLRGNDHYHAGDPDDFKKAVSNFELINQISGKEDKTVLPCELIPRKEARRSLVLTRNMKKGEQIKLEDLMPKRPGTGISPKYINIVIGRKIKEDLSEDTVLTWEMI